MQGQAITGGNEAVAAKQIEKKVISSQILKLKKDIVQARRQVKAVQNNSRQTEDDIRRLNELVHQKIDRNLHIQREIALAKRDVKVLQQDCEDLQ